MGKEWLGGSIQGREEWNQDVCQWIGILRGGIKNCKLWLLAEWIGRRFNSRVSRVAVGMFPHPFPATPITPSVRPQSAEALSSWNHFLLSMNWGVWEVRTVADCFLHPNVGNYTVIAWKSINPSFRCLTRLLDQTSSGTSWKPCKTSPQTHHNTCTLLSWMKNTIRDGGSTAL